MQITVIPPLLVLTHLKVLFVVLGENNDSVRLKMLGEVVVVVVLVKKNREYLKWDYSLQPHHS